MERWHCKYCQSSSDLGPFWDWLPEGALYHDPNAYLKAEGEAESTIASADVN